MAGSRWNRLSGDLAVATEHEFVRRIRPLLRVLWPALTETPQRQKWDSFGIDLVEWVDEGPFPTVVQCKGWHVQDIGTDQARQVDDSVQSFLDSGVSCEHFVVVHNRDGRFETFNKAALQSLNRLVEAGAAHRIALFDRQQLLLRVKDSLKASMIAGMRDSAVRRLGRLPHLFSHDREYIESVPFDRSTIRLRRNEPSLIESEEHDARGSVAQIILRARGLSWTIVEGMFGSGKTTAALHAAQARDRVVVLIACRDLPSTGTLSFNDVLVHAARELDLWERFDDGERAILEPLAADSAIRSLSNAAAASDYLLVLDGLDEHRAFYSLGGLQRLLNQLIDIECPVVLTTRSEHFATFFDSYTSAFAELSWKFKPDVPIPLLRLRAWTTAESVALIERVAMHETAEGAERLGVLAARVRSGDAEREYGTMPYNPLMLRFIIDDVAQRGLDTSDRAQLIARWAKRKLWRDVNSHAFVASGDVSDTVELLMRALERLAAQMTETKDGEVRLTESLSLEEVRRLVAAETPFDVADVLTNSFLMPIRSGRGTRVVFTLRVLQEFFLAAFYARHGTRTLAAFPADIRDLHSDLVQATDPESGAGV
ncbi:MAG: hypothetical protein C0497_12875 [Gemmatimonas sp.]|nr:hypothetical protein [Gemmatimonas sp.]